MLKIGDFSKLSLTTIKALRYYEKEGLLVPAYVDIDNGYRFYETYQLEDISKIKFLRQIGLSIEEIKKFSNGAQLKNLLISKKKELEKQLVNTSYQLKTINYIMEEKYMKYQALIKTLPACIVYYEERKLRDYSEITALVLESAEECLRLNPTLECLKPDYCFCEYLEGEYKKKDILTRYSQAVTRKGVENDRIHFKDLDAVEAICIYHKGSFSKIGDAYSFIINFAKENGYEMNGLVREVYIDGVWNKDDEDDYLTEIQIPIKKI